MVDEEITDIRLVSRVGKNSRQGAKIKRGPGSHLSGGRLITAKKSNQLPVTMRESSAIMA